MSLMGSVTPSGALVLALTVPLSTANAVQADVVETRTPALEKQIRQQSLIRLWLHKPSLFGLGLLNFGCPGVIGSWPKVLKRRR